MSAAMGHQASARWMGIRPVRRHSNAMEARKAQPPTSTPSGRVRDASPKSHGATVRRLLPFSPVDSVSSTRRSRPATRRRSKSRVSRPLLAHTAKLRVHARKSAGRTAIHRWPRGTRAQTNLTTMATSAAVAAKLRTSAIRSIPRPIAWKPASRRRGAARSRVRSGAGTWLGRYPSSRAIASWRLEFTSIRLRVAAPHRPGGGRQTSLLLLRSGPTFPGRVSAAHPRGGVMTRIRRALRTTAQTLIVLAFAAAPTIAWAGPGYVNFLFGQKIFDKDHWDPIDKQSAIGVEGVFGPATWPVSLDAYLSRASKEKSKAFDDGFGGTVDVTLDATTYEV